MASASNRHSFYSLIHWGKKAWISHLLNTISDIVASWGTQSASPKYFQFQIRKYLKYGEILQKLWKLQMLRNICELCCINMNKVYLKNGCAHPTSIFWKIALKLCIKYADPGSAELQKWSRSSLPDTTRNLFFRA